jgi:hypothetical protein
VTTGVGGHADDLISGRASPVRIGSSSFKPLARRRFFRAANCRRASARLTTTAGQRLRELITRSSSSRRAQTSRRRVEW